MARKKTASRRRYGGKKTLLWVILTIISGVGVGGYINPDWPVIGPLFKQLQSAKESILPAGGENAFSSAVGQPNLVAGQRPVDRIRIATFNIQVFGESKLSKPDVVQVLAQICRQFDIVAIQEVRAKSDEILPRFVDAINADGSQYTFLIGPRIGRSVSTEQYTFVYDTTRIEHDPSIFGTMPDPGDLLHREPLVARFRPRTAAPESAFTFWLVNIHTDPDEVKEEVDALADVFVAMQSARSDEDDVILLGDLNASGAQLGRLGQIPGIYWVVNDAMTNTRKTKAYDNMVLHSQATREYTGTWGVLDIESAFGITQEDALKVSDHLPVWAEFSIWEAPGQSNFAGQLSGFRR